MHIGHCVDIHLQFNLGFDISGDFSLPRELNTNIYTGLAYHSSQLIHLNCLVLFEGVRSFCFASSLFIPQSQRQFCEESKNRHITRVNLWHLQSQQISVRRESLDSEFNYVKNKKNSSLLFFSLSHHVFFLYRTNFLIFPILTSKRYASQMPYRCFIIVELLFLSGVLFKPSADWKNNVKGLN